MADAPSALTTNQAVTLTATVSADSVPAGAVEFDTEGTPIPDCMNQKLVRGADSATATCQTGLPAAPGGETITAEFRPMDGADLQGSTDGTELVVDKGATATAVSVSNGTPPVGEPVTYTATVAPDQAGFVEPLGAVQFLDGGVPIDACSDQSLSATESSSLATCTLSYGALGSHSITATYAGDDNFTGSSTSAAQTVTVQPALSSSNSSPPVPISSPAIHTPTPAPPGTAASSPRCKLALRTNRVSLVRRTHSRHSKPKAGMLTLSVSCDQSATVTLQGTVTRLPGGAAVRQGTIFRLRAAHAALHAGRARDLVIRLPGPALLPLRRGSREVAVFTLSATNASGTTRVQLRAPSLKL